MACPVCESDEPLPFGTFGGKAYWRCPNCLAIGLQSHHFLQPEAEKAHYDTHENIPDDPDYRRFLSRLAEPLLTRLKPNSSGLDYGCGPGPALACMLEQAGHTMALYDPYYRPDRGVLAQRYDFITCTEVAEHFHQPAREFARFDALLEPGGWLGIMTSFQTDDSRFGTWHYRSDPTHVVFYRQQTLEHIAQKFGWSCECPARNIILMHKPANAPGSEVAIP